MAYGTSAAGGVNDRGLFNVVAPKFVAWGGTAAGGAGGGAAPVGPVGYDQASFPGGGAEEGPFGLPLPLVIGGGVAMLAVVGLVIYKVKKKKKRK